MMGRTAIAKANEIRLKRQLHTGSFLVVEGRDDRLFFEQFTEQAVCKITTADGKRNVTDVIDTLEADHFPGVAGIVDADFDHVEARRSSSNNLIVLETVDLEALLVRSTALDRVLIELGSIEKIATFGRDVRETLVDAAAVIGCLRLHSLRARLNLTFQGLRYDSCVDRDALTVNVDALIHEVMKRSQRFDISRDDVAQQIASIHDSLDDYWLLCCGVDMVAILALGLRSALGTNNSGVVAPAVVRRCLRLAFPSSDLHSSQLGRDLRGWSTRNSEYRVFESVG